MKKKAVIFGITGMDGHNLSDYLLHLGYEVFGMMRRHSISSSQDQRIAYMNDSIKTYYGDLLDRSSIDHILREVQPDEIYNLAAMSHVRVSFEMPEFTLRTNFLGHQSVLESYRINCPNAKLYFAASSECFGLTVEKDGSQNELTIMNPTSPYGVSKVASYNLTRHYRRAYGLHAVCGILFNHTDCLRGENFVEQKIVKTAVMIKEGLVDKLELGNMDSNRDIGASKDYVRAMHLIINNEPADDFVVSTGETFSVRDICKMVFDKLGLNYQDYVVQNERYLRPEELPYLKGNSTKIRTQLGWQPEYTLEKIIDEMIACWSVKIKKYARIHL